MNYYPSSKVKGNELEDTIANLLTNWGYDVQTRIKLSDNLGTKHEIDVFGIKQTGVIEMSLAVECKHVSSPTDIIAVRNFHDKLTSLNINKGIIISTGGFTHDAENHANTLNVDLWNERTLQNNLNKYQTKQSAIIGNTSPITTNLLDYASLDHIHNKERVQIQTKYTLIFIPFFFANYRCHSQEKIGYHVYNLRSEGVAILNDSGAILSASAKQGEQPSLPYSSHYNSCINQHKVNIPTDYSQDGIRFDNIFTQKINLSNADRKSVV